MHLARSVVIIEQAEIGGVAICFCTDDRTVFAAIQIAAENVPAIVRDLDRAKATVEAVRAANFPPIAGSA